MVLGIECSGLESTSASEMVANHSEILSNSDETKNENKGISNPEAEHNQYKALEVVNSRPLVVAETSSPSPSPATAKGKGLKKWKRLKRDVNLDGGGNMDNGKPLKRGLSNLPTDVDKPVKFSAEQKQTSEGSASSSNAMWKDFSVSVVHFGGNADSGSAAGPILAAGTDSENSEDHSSKSTAASAPKMRHEVREKNKMKSVSGKKLATSLHKGHQGKPRTDTSKKQKGEQVKIEKENSHSSLESDSRTSHAVYGQGNNSATSNGIQRGKSMMSGEETSDEGHGVEQELGEDNQAGSSRKNGVFEVTSAEINGSPIDLDPLVESIMLLQSAQQELEKEVEKFREIGKEENIQEEISEQLESGELAQESAELVQESADILGIEVLYLKEETVKEPTTNGVHGEEDTEIELERLFKHKIEAEVEFVAITKTVQKMRGAVGEQIKIFEQQKSKQVNILEKKLEDAGQKAEMLKGQTEKIVTLYQDITDTDESLKLKSNVWKYASFFLLQLVLFVFILAVFLWQSGPYLPDFVPT